MYELKQWIELIDFSRHSLKEYNTLLAMKINGFTWMHQDILQTLFNKPLYFTAPTNTLSFRVLFENILIVRFSPFQGPKELLKN